MASTAHSSLLLSLLHCFLLVLLLSNTSAFQCHSRTSSYSRRTTHSSLYASSSFSPFPPSLFSSLQPSSFLLAEGLDAETLDALGDVQELNYALDGVVDNTVNPAVGILTKLAASPAIIGVPILAGLLVAFGFGYFVSSYGSGKDD